MTSTQSMTEKVAKRFGGGLIILGTLVMGLVEVLVGEPYHMPTTNDAGQIVSQPTIPPEIRATVIGAGLVIWFLYGLYVVTLKE